MGALRNGFWFGKFFYEDGNQCKYWVHDKGYPNTVSDFTISNKLVLVGRIFSLGGDGHASSHIFKDEDGLPAWEIVYGGLTNIMYYLQDNLRMFDYDPVTKQGKYFGFMRGGAVVHRPGENDNLYFRTSFTSAWWALEKATPRQCMVSTFVDPDNLANNT